MQNVYSVTQINKYIKNMFEQDFVLKRVYMRGEVSNCKYHSTGHIYFTVKDETSSMSAIMFASQRKGLAFRLEEGQKIIILGSINVYERDGKYQIYAKEIILDGVGVLYQKFETLKKELEEMGMFSAEYKQPIPQIVQKLGVVTASTGAAIRDIMNISYRRNPYVQIFLYPALVQGEGAKESIVKGIQLLDDMQLDCIIIGRGGGSIEDLWAFNEEIVARAVFEARTPIISAVGHETDTTIADFVSDLRAPTPSAAAELAVFDFQALENLFEEKQFSFDRAIENKIEKYKSNLNQYRLKLKYLSPAMQLKDKKEKIINYKDKLDKQFSEVLTRNKHRLQIYIQRLNGLSPLSKLEQGFAYIEKCETGISSVQDVNVDDEILVKMMDGTITAKVEKIEPVVRKGLLNE